MRKSLIILYCVFLLVLIYSCNREQKDFDSAKQENSIKALDEYITSYPDGEYADSARGIIDKLNWQSVVIKNTIGDYESFISGYPESKYVDSAKVMLDKQFPVSDILKALQSRMVKLELEGIKDESRVKLYVINNLQNPVRIRIPSGQTVLSTMQLGEFAVTSTVDTVLILDTNARTDQILVQSGSAKITKGLVVLSGDSITMKADAEILVSIGLNGF